MYEFNFQLFAINQLPCLLLLLHQNVSQSEPGAAWFLPQWASIGICLVPVTIMSLNNRKIISTNLIDFIMHIISFFKDLLFFLDLHFQDHHNVWFALESIHTLYKFRMMEAVHDANLLSHILLLFLREGFDKLPSPHLFGRLLHQFEDLTKFTTDRKEAKRKMVKEVQRPKKHIYYLENFALMSYVPKRSSTL